MTEPVALVTSTKPRESLRVVGLRLLLRLPLPKYKRFALQERLIEEAYKPELEAAKGKGRDAYREVYESEAYESRCLYQEREVELTRDLTREARRLRVPTPDFESNRDGEPEPPWVLARDVGYFYYLDEHGYKALRDAIREEKKARREARASTINWVTAITGLLGAAAAVLGAIAAIYALKK